MDPAKVLEKHEKAKKAKYVAACVERRRQFTPLVFSVDGLRGVEAEAASKKLAGHLAIKWQSPYSVTCGYVRARLSIALARTSSQCLRGARDHDARRPSGAHIEDEAGLRAAMRALAVTPGM